MIIKIKLHPNSSQEKIEKFDEARGWKGDWHLKDLALNITEEVGELWNLIKWVDEEKQREIIKEHKEKASDFIGDTLFLILKMANKMGIDAEESLNNTLEEYEKRMPADKMKEVKHANKLSGGVDDKDD